MLVRNETPNRITFVSGTDDSPEETTYIMMRAAGGGTILGGCYQKGQADPVPDMEMSKRIMQRAVDICPELVSEGKGVAGLDVIRHSVGLRPARDGGPRVEKDKMQAECWVIHNYGHGGAGYQCSYGCAVEVVRLVEEVLGSKSKAQL